MMKRELVMDARAKTQSFTFITNSYYKNYMYSLGEQYFFVKSRYQHMMSLYMEMEEVPTREYQLYVCNIQ